MTTPSVWCPCCGENARWSPPYWWICDCDLRASPSVWANLMWLRRCVDNAAVALEAPFDKDEDIQLALRGGR